MSNNMKITSILVILTLVAQTAYGQWKKGYDQNDWAISYGYSSATVHTDALSEVEMSDPALGNIETSNRKSVGSFSAQYTHRKGRIFSYGAILAFERTTMDCNVVRRKQQGLMKPAGSQSQSEIISSYKHGELANTYISIMPMFRLNWKETKKIAIYSKAALGFTLIGDSYSNTSGEGTTGIYSVDAGATSAKRRYVAYQISPLGLIVGSKACGFAEIGYGTLGIAQVGFLYRF